MYDDQSMMEINTIRAGGYHEGIDGGAVPESKHQFQEDVYH